MFEPASLASLRGLRDLGVAYQLRIAQLCTPSSIADLTFDAGPPHLSPIPASVTALSLGVSYAHRDISASSWGVRCGAAITAAASDWQGREPWHLLHPDPSPQSCEEEWKSWQGTWKERFINGANCSFLPRFSECRFGLDCPLWRPAL